MTTAISSTGRKGDIRIAFGYVKVQEYGLPEPAIFLYLVNSKNVMVHVPSCYMHEFDERQRHPITKEPLCKPKCEQIADALFGHYTTYGWKRVLSALSEWMTDVKNLPPPSTYRNPEQALAYMKQHGFDVIEDY